eukprot:gnl/MRDRNA2_/MRDRNA2_29801_c0_seq1.p1 gnl/MRDRNA2_/MRDRNA2_29801_c0~~gnl/MRDRNA2_/MRDRNA2_29801_c0_seq1.p1  ORF type:complete len:485 (+),score=60.26 gnl/MRDRNA2_/MRDRNA2_29801_c0_seq1:290-1744(+)
MEWLVLQSATCVVALALVAASVSYRITDFLHTGGTLMVISFSTVIIVWSRIAWNLWEREEAYFRQVWNVHDKDEEHQQIIRPRFRGTKVVASHDSTKVEKQYPDSLSALRRIASFFVTVFFCSLVAAFIVIWYEIFQGRLTLISSILLVIQMKVFEVGWNAFTPVLTEFENHKYNQTYFDSYIWKNFGFQAVNKYGAYFYLAFKLQYSIGVCPDGNCLAMLQGLLIKIQITLFLTNIGLLIASSYWVKFTLWYEIYHYKKTHAGEDPPERPRSEEEAKMRKFKKEDQINIMCRLMLSLGFIILFGGVVPIVVPVGLLHFSLNLRLGAQVLVSYTQRPFPRKLFGIGAWKDILLLLMRVGVLFSGFMMVSNGKTFSGAPVITKLTGFMLYCCAMFVAWGIVDCIVPPTTKDAMILRRQNQCVLTEINRKCQEADDDEEAITKCRINRKAEIGELPIIRAAWSEIRPLALRSLNAFDDSPQSPYGL